MKKFIGKHLLIVGARLWQNGGWTGDESYGDLTIIGKLGYRMFYAGVVLLCGSVEEFHRRVDGAFNE